MTVSKKQVVGIIVAASIIALGIGVSLQKKSVREFETRATIDVERAEEGSGESMAENLTTPELGEEVTSQTNTPDANGKFADAAPPTEAIIKKQEEVIQENVPIKSKLISWGYESASGRNIYAVILHSSYNSLRGDEYSVDAIVDIYKHYGVGAHYIIARDGTIYRLVEEKNIAYHAGISALPDGETNVNGVSIGIELVGNETDGFTSGEYASVNDLLDDIRSRYNISYVLGHSDIAPERKTDPWNIDWKKINK